MLQCKLVSEMKPDFIRKFWFHFQQLRYYGKKGGSDIIKTLLSKTSSRTLVFWRPQNTRVEDMFEKYEFFLQGQKITFIMFTLILYLDQTPNQKYSFLNYMREAIV